MAAASESRRPKEQRCNICGLVFQSAEALEAHKRMEHGTANTPPAGVG